MWRILWLLLGVPLTLSAQVTPLWQTTLSTPLPTNPPPGDFVTNAFLNASAVDAQGNTIVAADVSLVSGMGGSNCWIGMAGFIAKLSPTGQQLWASLSAPVLPGKGLVLGPDGSIVVRSFQAPGLAKYAPDGSLLWQASPAAVGWQFFGCTNAIAAFGAGPTSLALDALGNVGVGYLSLDPATFLPHWFVAKLDSGGTLLWRVALPAGAPSLASSSTAQFTLLACADNSWVVAGASSPTGGFITKLSPDGQVTWNLQQDKNSQPLPVFAGLLVNPKDRLCVVSSNLSQVFSANGKLQNAAAVGGAALGVTADADFLVGSSEGVFYKLNATSGHLVWTAQAPLPGQRLGVVPVGTGWVVASRQPGDVTLHFEALDGRTGDVTWQQILAFGSWPSPQDWPQSSPSDTLLAAPDSSLRLVAQSANQTIQVLGFSLTH